MAVNGKITLAIIRLHRMHEMQITATDVPVCQSICLSRNFTRLRCTETFERTEVLFGVKIFGPMKHYFKRGSLSLHDAASAKLLWSFVCCTIVTNSYIQYIKLTVITL